MTERAFENVRDGVITLRCIEFESLSSVDTSEMKPGDCLLQSGHPTPPPTPIDLWSVEDDGSLKPIEWVYTEARDWHTKPPQYGYLFNAYASEIPLDGSYIAEHWYESVRNKPIKFRINCSVCGSLSYIESFGAEVIQLVCPNPECENSNVEIFNKWD